MNRYSRDGIPETAASIEFCPTPSDCRATPNPALDVHSNAPMILSVIDPDKVAVIVSVIAISVVTRVTQIEIVEPSSTAPPAVSVYSPSFVQVFPTLSVRPVCVAVLPSVVARFFVATCTTAIRPTTIAADGDIAIEVSAVASTAKPRFNRPLNAIGYSANHPAAFTVTLMLPPLGVMMATSR